MKLVDVGENLFEQKMLAIGMFHNKIFEQALGTPV